MITNYSNNLWTFILLCSFGITFSQNVFVSDRGNNAIYTYDFEGNRQGAFASPGEGGIINPQDIIFHPDGFYLVTGFGNNRLKKFDIDGTYLEDWGDIIIAPSKMTLHTDNLIYITQWGTSGSTARVIKMDLDGNNLGPFTLSPAPRGLGHTWDASGNFYVSLWEPSSNGVVQVYDTDGNFIEDFVDSTVLAAPTYCWFEEGTGDMLVEDWFGNSVLRYDSSGNFIETFISGVVNPEGYAYLPNGNLLICERGANKISEFEADGTPLGQWNDSNSLNTPNFVKIVTPNFSIETNSKIHNWVAPTIGTFFRFDQNQEVEFGSIDVMTSNGVQIQSLDPSQFDQWNASAVSEGIYFLVARTKDGTRSIQKVVVKK